MFSVFRVDLFGRCCCAAACSTDGVTPATRPCVCGSSTCAIGQRCNGSICAGQYSRSHTVRNRARNSWSLLRIAVQHHAPTKTKHAPLSIAWRCAASGCGATVHEGANYIGRWAAVTSENCGSWVEAESYWSDNVNFERNAVASVKVFGAGCSLAVATANGGGGTTLALSEGHHNIPLDSAVRNSIQSVKLICSNSSPLSAQPSAHSRIIWHNMPPRHFAGSRCRFLHVWRGLTRSRVLQGHVQ